MTVKRKILLVVSSFIFVLAILFNMVIAVGYVSGHSMLPTIHDGQVAMALNEKSLAFLDRHGRPLWRDDIVIVRQVVPGMGDKAQFLMKRVIGVPHDQVVIGRRTVELNGRLLKEPYLNPRGMDNVSYHYVGIDHGGVRFKTPGYVDRNDLGPEYYWVMGDNREQSTDSRMFGPVQRSQITERVVWAMPLSYYTVVGRAVRALLVLSPIWAGVIWVAMMIWLFVWPVVGEQVFE